MDDPRRVSDPAHGGFPPAELVEDFRLACVSRAIDDGEIRMQKQSRVFFQISGAGHEALGLAVARSLRPGYDWFFPYYRDQALCLGLGVTPTDVLLQAVGSADDPSSGGRQMPSHWGSAERNIVTQSSPTGSQCNPAVGCAEAGRYSPAPGASGDGTGVSLPRRLPHSAARRPTIIATNVTRYTWPMTASLLASSRPRWVAAVRSP